MKLIAKYREVLLQQSILEVLHELVGVMPCTPSLVSAVTSPTVIILKEALAYFPVLACVNAPVRVVGYIVGFFYTLLL